MADGSGPILARGLTVIGFAGGGGSSWALKKATGREPDLAMNHWDVAVHTHRRLFPSTEHYLADIYDVDPMGWRPGEPIRWAWFSPDCTDHSKAKGGAPKSERIRGLAWVVIPWAKARKPQTIMLENVEEWFDWGPVYRRPDDWRAGGVIGRVGDPIKALRGSTRWLFGRRLNQCGYWWEVRFLRTADYGVPTTRKRLYLIAEYVGVERVEKISLGIEPSPIRWAEPTRAPRKQAAKKGLPPWIGFDTCADWSEPCPSLFLTPAEVAELKATTGRSVKRPLVAATLKRVARGLDRYVISAAEPFIVPITHQGDSRAHAVRDPLRTITAAKGGEFSLIAPTLVPRYGEREGQAPRAIDVTEPYPAVVPKANGGDIAAAHLIRTNFHSAAARNGIRSAEEPIATVTGDGGLGVVAASLQQMNTHDVGQAADDPLRTVAGHDHQALLAASIVGCGGRRGQSPPTDVGEPMPTVTGKADACLTSAYLVRQFGTSVAGSEVGEPAPTVMPDGGGKTQLVSAIMAQGNGERLGRPADEPLTTLTGRSTQQQLVAAHLGSYYGTQHGSDPADPMLTCTGKDRHALTMAWLMQANTGMVGHQLGEPISTIVGKGCTQQLIEARLELDGGPIERRAQVLEFLWSHFGLPTPDEWADPTATLEARKKFGLVILSEQVWMIVDIGLRMLLAKELARATGLPDDHDLSRDAFGRAVSKTHQTMMIGNMVPSEPAASLIATQCPDMIEEREAA